MRKEKKGVSEVCALVGKRFEEREKGKNAQTEKERKRMIFAALWDWEGVKRRHNILFFLFGIYFYD